MQWTESTLAEFRSAFDERRLSHAEWTHSAHLVAACLYNLEYAAPEALARIRSGILALNAAQGVETTLERGYHETLTRVWMSLVRSILEERPNASTVEQVERVLDRCADRNLPLLHYSRDRLFSAEARFGFVAPDLAPIPGLLVEPLSLRREIL